MEEQYSDEELLRGLIERDTYLTSILYEDLFRKAYSILKYRGANSEDVRDIVQDSIVALYTNIRKKTFSLSPETKLTTYLMQVCKYQWYNQSRKKETKNLQLEDESFHFRDDQSMQNDMEIIERNNLISQAIDQLGDKCKELLRLYYWENLSMEEIGEKLSMKPNSAKNGKYRCMQSLREILSRLKENKLI